MKKVLYILIALIISINLKAQTDSLKIMEIQTQLLKTNVDSIKIRLLLQLSEQIFTTNPEHAVDLLKEAIQLSSKTDNLKGLAESYRNTGTAYYYLYNFDSTLYFYNLSLEVYNQLGDLGGIAKIYKNIGLTYQVKGNLNKAIENYNQSLSIYQKLDDKNQIAECHNNIGAAFYDQGNYEKALDNYFSGLRLSEELKNTKMTIATLANIGGIYEAQEKNEKALDYYFKANHLTNIDEFPTYMADTYRNIGGIYSAMDKFDSALVVYDQALAIYNKLNDKRGIIVMYNFFGQVYINQSERKANVKIADFLKRAEYYYQQSIDLNKKEVNDNDELCSSYQGLGEIALHKGDYHSAINYFNQVIELGQHIQSVRSLRSAYEYIAKAYAATDNYKKAYENYLLFKNWNDSLKSDENIELLTQMSMQYSFDKEQVLKDLEYQQKLKRQRLVRYFILIVLLIVSAFSVQVFRSYQQKKQDNVLLAHQKEEIEKQKEEITDSIKYAKRIQNAILPSLDYAKEILPEHFILFRPRDIVSGDYYWMHRTGNTLIVAAADCTGHGVPGAFMSMLGVSFLNEIVHKENLLQPHLILNKLRESVKRTLGQTGKEGEAKDGMDIAMVVVNFDTMILQYAGAYNPLYLYRNGELIETKADKMPIGIYIKEKESFTNNEMPIQKGDTFYVFSDGYHDQFGGKDGGKYKSIPFKNYLGSIQSYNMAEQRELLNTNIDNWKGNLDQTDDIIVIGVRI